MTTGLLGGASAKERGATFNPVANMLSMSAGDGLIAIVQVEAVFKICGAKGFRRWNSESFLRHVLSGSDPEYSRFCRVEKTFSGLQVIVGSTDTCDGSSDGTEPGTLDNTAFHPIYHTREMASRDSRDRMIIHPRFLYFGVLRPEILFLRLPLDALRGAFRPEVRTRPRLDALRPEVLLRVLLDTLLDALLDNLLDASLILFSTLLAVFPRILSFLK